MLWLIETATESIHLQTYIYEDDETGKLVASALAAAVSRNVAVYLMADGYASKAMSKDFIQGLKKAGIHFRFFAPLFKTKYFYFGRRMHHKVLVVDAKMAMVGGINISNRYNDMPKKSAWLDFAVFVEGEVAVNLCVLCWKSWNGYPPQMGTTPCEKIKPGLLIAPGEQCDIRMSRNDWVRRKNEISATYIEILRKAKSEVTFLCSYFLPGKFIRRQMINAIKRGVTIRVISAGHLDVMLAKPAERWMYDWLLRNGIELYEYQKNILHGKLAVCDDQWMTIGSYNINDLSAYASIELNLDIRNAAFAKGLRNDLQAIITEDCVAITMAYHTKTKNLLIQFSRWISYKCYRVVLYLFTFYFKHKK